MLKMTPKYESEMSGKNNVHVSEKEKPRDAESTWYEGTYHRPMIWANGKYSVPKGLENIIKLGHGSLDWKDNMVEGNFSILCVANDE